MSQAFDFRDFHRNQRGRMFQSDFLEFFSKVHPAMPFVFWIPVAAGIEGWALMTGVTTPLKALSMAPLGFFTWQFLEYFIHGKNFNQMEPLVQPAHLYVARHQVNAVKELLEPVQLQFLGVTPAEE